MRLGEIFKSAFASIWSMKVRSFLTSLGVIIGVFSIAALLGVGNSATENIQKTMEGLNANIIKASITDNDTSIELSELKELKNANTSIAYTAPTIKGNAEVKNGFNSMNVSTIGTTGEHIDVNSYELASGRSLLPLDITENNKSVVLGFTVAMKLFGNTDVIGEKIDIDGQEFVVVGVLQKQAGTWMGDPNEEIMIPYTTGQELFEMSEIKSFTVLASSDDMADKATSDIKSFLTQKTGDLDKFYVNSAGQTQEVMKEMNTTLMALLGGIGGISLLISGIGIMNIMLVSVRERTREIGIRKAIGAKRKDVLVQFLVEAVVLSGLGGIIGILMTIILAAPIGTLMNNEISLTSGIVALSLVFSLIAGIVFGLYPAAKASKLRPIEALRYE